MVKNTWISRTAARLDLPEDLISDLPRIEWIAMRTLKIENHKGLNHFSDSCIALHIASGILMIEGEDLSVSSLTHDEVSIHGHIHSISLKG
ncbi:hypothetical protein KP77_04080 [Jeotgalibacillus alimentarius]|uniref:Sporulation protein YqfC n=1 Tax=Jeotgalibacillus alimentarius TaxID=135826 RepID=A0A0C2VX46_9BACL|nr:YabP/YqfC family sporulation protein [Jeotgalibacillus alimentarius]KIL53432.1 hypothetical protein KP77_04080 [Jeotgalibacillus alimentarius]